MSAFWITIVLGLAILVAGIAKCWSISRRPTTNKKCVLGLMLLLVAWVISFCRTALIALIPVPASVALFVALGSFGVAMAAAVLAAAGLHECSRTAYYTQGKAQAIWTLVLSATIIALTIFVAKGFTPHGSGKDRYALGGRPLVFQEHNFKFLHPGKQWTEDATNDLPGNTALAFVSTRPATHFALVVEKPGREAYTVSDLAQDVMENLRGTSDTVQPVYRGPLRVDWLAGLRLYTEADRRGQKLYYEHRLFVTNGFAYQLIAWGDHGDRKLISADAEYLVRRFELLDYSLGSRAKTNSAFRERFLQ